jgi:hypothetical protein
MKIIEAMKEIKALQERNDDLRRKVAQFCTDMDFETPTYGTTQQQRAQIEEWLQSHSDTVREVLRLRVAIQRTNLATEVTIELDGKSVKKTIAEWIHRRRDLATEEREMWTGLGRKESGMREGTISTSTGDQKDVKIRRYYDPKIRDEKIEMFRNEPHKIDATLEVINAVTDLIEK